MQLTFGVEGKEGIAYLRESELDEEKEGLLGRQRRDGIYMLCVCLLEVL